MSVAIGLLALLGGAPAPLAFPCHSFPLTPVVRRQEAAAIAAATHRPVTPARIDYLLASGDWKMVWTSPGQEARNVYLFHRVGGTWRLADTWHGDLGTDDDAAGVAWAQQRHVPNDLAHCFGTVLVNHP